MRTRQAIIVVASVLALALAAGAVLAASARATFPGRNGLITFSAPVAGIDEIFVMNPDGSGQKQITHGPANYGNPSIAPDGKTIVFTQSTASSWEIRAMTTTGADSRHLATGACDDPSFSPNGKQVVFLAGKPTQVWVMNANGTHQRRLTAFTNAETHAEGLLSPTYSPDGKTIVFVASIKYRGEILAMNPDGTHLRRLAYTDVLGDWPTMGVSFSPDGKTIVYGAFPKSAATTGEPIIDIMNADGTGQRLLPRSYGFGWPCYSPDGHQIVCVSDVHHQICVVRADGTHWRQLTHVAEGVYDPANWGPHVR